MRLLVVTALLVTIRGRGFCQDDLPSWFHNAKEFCKELSARSNGKGSPVPIGKPKATRFADYATRPIATPRIDEAVIGKYDWTEKGTFESSIKAELVKGPDFAGRYAIVEWSCGTWCANATIADVVTARTYDTPFVGVIGCQGVTGDFSTIQREADSSLLIVRGSLEMTYGQSFSEGPCGTFYFRWDANRLRLMGCDIRETITPAR